MYIFVTTPALTRVYVCVCADSRAGEAVMTAWLLAVFCRDAVYCRALNATDRQLWSFPPRYPGRCVQHVGSCSQVIKASGIPHGHISVVRTCRSRNVEFLNTWAYRQSLSHERGKSHVWATHSLHTHLLASLRPIKPTIERGHMIRSWAGGVRGWSQMSGEEQKMEKKVFVDCWWFQSSCRISSWFICISV